MTILNTEPQILRKYLSKEEIIFRDAAYYKNKGLYFIEKEVDS